VDLFSSFLEALKTKAVPEHYFPERVFIFGISALPSFYMDVFHAVSKFSDVHLFLLNPCGEYWGDILSERERSGKKKKSQGIDTDDLYLSRGNRLLGSLGKIGRDFFDLLQKYSCRDFNLFQPPNKENLLAWIQDDIFQLNDPGDKDYTRRTIDETDRSVQLHCCHSPLREVEVLYDRLYAMFDEDNTLNPRDILVMMTDCEAYAPLVHSVFGKKPEDRDWIPYSVADLGFASESRIAGVFLALLDMKKGRFTVSEVLGFLEEEAVRAAFNIREEDLETIGLWVRQVNIRWGWDAEHRKRVNLPEFDDCSWMAGLKRLLLGYAMPGHDLFLFHGILPYDGIEGKQGELLGLFMDYAEALYRWVTGLDDVRTPESWESHLLYGIKTFFKTDETNEHEIGILREEILGFRGISDFVGLDEPVDFSVIRYHLGKTLETKEQGLGFITGGVTFCAMLPMRSIPFRTICILGMNSNAYPRQGQTPGFDLMAKNPRPGDRSRRNDDRYLFLEALISARDTLYISYTGRSIRDNKLIQPSVLVCELLDYIEAGFGCGAGDVRERVTLEHPLQPFSPRYFEHDHREGLNQGNGLHLFSFSKENYLAALTGVSSQGVISGGQNLDAVVLAGDDRSKPNGYLPESGDKAVGRGLATAQTPFFQGELDLSEHEFHDLTVNDFCRFFRHPARYLLEKRLGLTIAGGSDLIEETEPFEIKGLERYALSDRLVDHVLKDTDEKALYTWARATGSLPLGRKGEIVFSDLKDSASSLAQGVRSVTKTREKKSVAVDVTVNGVRISGTIGDMYDGRLIRFRPSGIGGKDLLDLWIRHVLLCASQPDDQLKHSFVFGLDRSKDDPLTGFQFARVDGPTTILKTLVSLYLQGLKSPLHFFPSSSLSFWEARDKEKDEAEAMEAAKKVWAGSDYSSSEADDPYLQLCFKDLDPLDQAFVDCSTAVYKPMFHHRIKITSGDLS
jgi:exodeoxyribonuclease V gamma subunit